MRFDPRRHALGMALTALYGAAFLWPFRGFFPRFSTHLIADHGDTLLLHLHCAWQWLALAEDRASELLRLPTLHPYSSGMAFGEPLLGVALPFAPVHALTGSTAAAFNAAVLASFLLLGVAIFLWARDLFASPTAGLLAAVLVIFNPWRVHFLSALNLLTIHYLLFGLWLIGRWLRRPRLATLLGAALLFHVQLITAAQAAIAGIYLACIWLAVVWVHSRFRWSRARVVQGLVASCLFVGLGLPWLGFFQEAFDATSGLLRTTDMQLFSSPFASMLRRLGGFSELGGLAALGVPALIFAAKRKLLPPGTGADLLGLGCGIVTLFVLARGPYLGPDADPTALPGYYAARYLPLLDLLRAPIRLAALTPVYLALLAGGGLAVVQLLVRHRVAERWAPLWFLVPLVFTWLWPELDRGMASPIFLRPQDRELATELGRLPPESAILSLPLQLNHRGGSAVDERVLIHRRAQIGGFASIVPEVFWNAQRALGQWPEGGHAMAQALGATHLVVPEGWVRRQRVAVDRHGYRVVATVAGHSIVAMPPREEVEPAFELRVPSVAAEDRWLTLSLFQSAPSFHPRGHQELSATWRGPDRETRVPALALFPGVAGPTDPILIHVPTPAGAGRTRLLVDLPLHPIETTVELGRHLTSFDAPIRDASISLASGSRLPASVRADSAFGLEVELEASAGPILLATSIQGLPDRRGATSLAYQFRGGGQTLTARPRQQAVLAGDLAPGDRIRQRWYLMAPRRPGRYDLFVRLTVMGAETNPMPWVRLVTGLRVVPE
jgi:hypothetical protein